MFGIPMEALVMLGGAIFGGVMQMWAQSKQDLADERKARLQQFDKSEESVQSAREYQNPNAAWIRRFIVVTFVGMAGFILTAPIWGYQTMVPVEITSGFKWLFFDFRTTNTQYLALEGMVTPTWLPFSINMIIGFYFGKAMASRR